MRDVKKIVRNNALLVPLALALSWGCRDGVEHATVDELLSKAPEEVVASVDDHPIGAAEVRLEMERSGKGAEASLDALFEREVLVRDAISRGEGGDRYLVKAAAVRAMLEDEIERKVTTEAVDPEAVDAVVPEVLRELSRPEGFEVSAISVFIPRTVNGAAPTEDQREEWAPIAQREAVRVREWMAEDPSPERVATFDRSTLEAPISASVRRKMTIVHPRELEEAELPEGWSPNAAIADTAARLTDGEVGVVDAGKVYFVVARHSKIERVRPSEEEQRRRAKEIARDEKRREVLQAWIEELRREATVELYPGVVERAAEGTAPNAP